jgi:hypothetical protein
MTVPCLAALQLLPPSAAEDLWKWEPPRQGGVAGRKRQPSGNAAPELGPGSSSSGSEEEEREAAQFTTGAAGLAATLPQRPAAAPRQRRPGVPNRMGAAGRTTTTTTSSSRRAPLPPAPPGHDLSDPWAVPADAAEAAGQLGPGVGELQGEPPLVITPAGAPGPVLQVRRAQQQSATTRCVAHGALPHC